MTTEIVLKYFPHISDEQLRRFDALQELYTYWNAQINVISRKDIGNLYEHHVLHSLAIAKFISFRERTKILDFGTGGGFPGIPLAILFPQCDFKLIDGTGKKIKVVDEVVKSLGMKNVRTAHLRGEDEKEKFQFIVSRAVTALPDLVKLVKKNVAKNQLNALPNGLICLKGGHFEEEIKPMKKIAEQWPIGDFFDEEWFNEKYIVYVPL